MFLSCPCPGDLGPYQGLSFRQRCFQLGELKRIFLGGIQAPEGEPLLFAGEKTDEFKYPHIWELYLLY